MFWLDYVASQHNEKDRTLTKESESSQRTTQVIYPSFSNFETAYLINKTKALNETDSKTCSWMRRLQPAITYRHNSRVFFMCKNSNAPTAGRLSCPLMLPT